MTPAAKVTYLSALLIGLLVGLPLGYRQTMNNLKLYGEMRFEMPPLALEDFSRDQYAHADSEHGRAALLTYASVLETMETAKAEKSLMFELSNTYMRLALLEDTGNNPEQSHAFMTKARYWHSAAGGRDYSESEESEIKAALKRFDALR
jgi:hypothetical protein